jgi:hypothetical protein
MMPDSQRVSLSDYMTRRLAAGQVVFSPKEALADLKISRRGFLKAAEREQGRHRLFNPRHGFYVVVPPQYLSWKAPPPAWYIDDLMRHEGHAYYVGLLKAAELHGATHQAVMEFQVVTDKRIPNIRAGRSIIAFFYRKNIARIAEAVVDHKTDTGRMKISSGTVRCQESFPTISRPLCATHPTAFANLCLRVGACRDRHSLAVRPSPTFAIQKVRTGVHG